VARLAGASAPPDVRIRTRRRHRSLEAIGVENAREGCVRETFAALLAERQAQRATLPGLPQTMATIARDEARHAALSWQIAAFIDARVSSRARRRIARARHAAIRDLRRELLRGSDTEQGPLGLPAASEAVALLDALAPAMRALQAESRPPRP